MDPFSLLVSGVLSLIAASVLSSIFGYSTDAGYHLPGGSLVPKETAVILKAGKIAAAGATSVAVGAWILSMGPIIALGVVLFGVIVVLHGDIAGWKFP